MVRTLLTLSIAAAVVAALTGCGSSSPSASSTPTPTSTGAATTAAGACSPLKAGAVSASVTVSGKVGQKPTVKVPSPLKVSGAGQRTVVVAGDGPEAKALHVADVAIAVYNGKTGKELSSTGFGGTPPIRMVVDSTSPQYIPGIDDAIECLAQGTRAVTTMTVASAFGGADPSAAGLTKDGTVVFVPDVLDVLPLAADGAPVTPKAGFPTVTSAADGTPKVTIPKAAAPKTTVSEVLRQGDGATVGSGDTVTLQYQGVNWRTGKVFDQSWGREPLIAAASGFVPGFSKAIEGQKVGSRILVVIAPADGYGKNGNSQAGIKGTDHLVFVVDILGTQTLATQ